MNNSITERKAVYYTAQAFTNLTWFFREQPISDIGIDALVETRAENGQPSGSFLAIQIKGGESNFHRSKRGLTFYFSDQHCSYWLTTKIPMIVVLYSPIDNKLFWNQITSKDITKTRTGWKMMIPFSNILDQSAINSLEQIIRDYYNTHDDSNWPIVSQYSFQEEKRSLVVNYCLYKKQLYCEINKNSETISIGLNYYPENSLWDKKKKELAFESPYHSLKEDIKCYILEKDEKKKLNQNSLLVIKTEVEKLVVNKGIEGISRHIFNFRNRNHNIPTYDKFIGAFEQYSNLNASQYKVQISGTSLYFHVGDAIFEMNTYEGKIKELKDYIDGRAYEEICEMTDLWIWSAIYIDGGILKEDFVPRMHNEWEKYWDTIYESVEQFFDSTDKVDDIKAKSYRQLQTFIQTYESAGDIIKLSYDTDDFILYPIAVISMMNIFNAEICYNEYCEWEFYSSSEWESITLNEEDEEEPIFFIRPY